MATKPTTYPNDRIGIESRLVRLEEQMREIRDTNLRYLSAKIDTVDSKVDSVESKVDKLTANQAKWIGGGAVIIFLSQMAFAYILSRH